MQRLATLFALLLMMSLTACGQDTAPRLKQAMVATANVHASEAAAEMLSKGGSATDAAVAAQLVLTLTEPQSSGIGGGLFSLHFEAATRTVTTFDGREKAPAAATEDRFEGLGFFAAWQSGLSVGVPGTPRLMESLRLDWYSSKSQTVYGTFGGVFIGSDSEFKSRRNLKTGKIEHWVSV